MQNLYHIDGMFSNIQEFYARSQQGYPPFNILLHRPDEKSDQTPGTTLQLAVAGFKKSELKIEIDTTGTTLVVYSDAAKRVMDNCVIQHQGISTRSFVRKFPFSVAIAVESATLEDGMLSVKVVVADDKSKTIKIS